MAQAQAQPQDLQRSLDRIRSFQVSPDSILSLHKLWAEITMIPDAPHFTASGEDKSGGKPRLQRGCLTPFHDPEGKEQ